MNRPPEVQRANAAHEEWELRVQDWLDGTASAEETAAVQDHVASCPSCMQLTQALRRVDEELLAAVLTQTEPGTQFETLLFNRIATEDATRQRARNTPREAEPQEALAALRRAWHRSLLRILAVGCLLAVGLIWAVVSGALPFLSPATIAVTVAKITLLQWLVIGLAGGAAAAGLARWLQAS